MKAKNFIPLIAFIALVALLGVGLTLNPREVPSPLINKPAPAFALPELYEPERELGSQDFLGQVSLFNVWASWCVSCRHEHPLLVELARRTDLPIYGLNYKDTRPEAKRWLQTFGNPYAAIAFDEAGRVGIDYGVYGVPETYVIDRKGNIRYKQIGPITVEDLNETILPLIKELQNEPA